jgi:hypothetical protein
MNKPTHFCYHICLIVIATLLVSPLATALHKPKKGPAEWRGYKFKKQDMKVAEAECDHGGKPLPEYVPTVRDGEPNLALLEKGGFKVLNTIAGWCPKRHCDYFINDGFYNNCRGWIIGALPSWGQIDISGVGTINRIFIGSDHSQGFADRTPHDFDILVSAVKAAEKSNAPTWKKVYTHKGDPIRETTEIKFKEVEARWLRVHMRSAGGARIDELEIYGGSNPLSVDPVSKLTTTWSEIKTHPEHKR